MKLIAIISCYALACIFIACAPAADKLPGPPSSSPPVTNQPSIIQTIEPSGVLTAGPSTLEPIVELQTFQDDKLGVEFEYPSDWETLPRDSDAPPGVALHAPPAGDNPEPIIFTVNVEARPASDRSVHDAVDHEIKRLSQSAKKRVVRTMTRLGGEDAEQLTGLPSKGGSVETFILHNGRLYHFVLEPYDESNTSLQPFLPKMKSIYEGLLQSVTFLN